MNHILATNDDSLPFGSFPGENKFLLFSSIHWISEMQMGTGGFYFFESMYLGNNSMIPGPKYYMGKDQKTNLQFLNY